MATRLQKPADPCMRWTSAGLLGKKEDAHSWSKMMMMGWAKVVVSCFCI